MTAGTTTATDGSAAGPGRGADASAVDVTLPGEGEPDAVDTWISAHATRFCRR